MTQKPAQTTQQRTVTADELVQQGDTSVILDEVINRLCSTADQKTKDSIQQALSYVIDKAVSAEGDTADLFEQIDQWLAAVSSSLEAQLSRQMDQILHSEQFREFEGRWRGLEEVAKEITGEMEVSFFSASLQELRDDAKRAGKKLDRSRLYYKLYQEGIGVGGKTPIAAAFLGHYVTTSDPDVELLIKLSDYGADIHAPVFTNASPKIFGADSFGTLPGMVAEDIANKLAVATSWKKLRAHENSRYLGVVLPRVLARLPYDPSTNPAGESYAHYKEQLGSASDYVYSAASYCMARQVLASFKRTGLPHNIAGQMSGGAVTGLVAESGKFPTESLIDFKQEKTLSNDLGFIPLMGVANSPDAYFAAVPSVQRLKDFGKTAEGIDATANFARGSQLDNMLLISRFAHCITAMQRSMVGERLDGMYIKQQLDEWLHNFKYPKGMRVTPERAREYPIKEYEVDVKVDPSRPGWYTIGVKITPIDSYQGADIAMSFTGEDKALT